MNNFATSLLKMVALAGGAVLGTLIARWMEETISKQAEERSEHDRTRYAQGLAPVQRIEVQEEQ